MGVYDYSRGNGHLCARIPVVFGSWLKSTLQVKNKDFISWHGRIPPRKDSISLRLSHLVVESLTSKVYLQKPVKDPGGAHDTNRYLCTCTYIVRLRLRTGFNADRLLESAREFGRSISLETHYRCLDAMTPEELTQYKQFSEDYRKGNYVPKTPAIVKAIEKTKRKKDRGSPRMTSRNSHHRWALMRTASNTLPSPRTSQKHELRQHL